MCTRATNTEKRVGLRAAWLLGIAIILTWGTAAWASTRLLEGDVEVQAWYRTRHTFQTDGNNHFDWVQWRNEAFVWLIHNNVVKNGNLFKTGIPIPFVHHAAFSARFRARVDPVYYLREHYDHLYDSHEKSKFFAPEKMFRDLYIDLDHGDIGPGSLSTRIGYQQIVWGESDLYRSLDIINPLRIDQNFGVGEKFDEFRTPLLAIKFLYSIGNIGESLSEVAIEPFYTPRWRAGNQYLIIEEGWRIPFQERGCLPPGTTQILDYSPDNCGKAGTKFLPFRPFWVGTRRFRHPWSLDIVGNNAHVNATDFLCATHRCAADVPGDRFSVVVNVPKGHFHHHTRGTDPAHGSGGVRLVGKTWFGLDFSLNYIYIPTVYADSNSNHPTKIYGDFPGADGSFKEGLLRCLSPSGKQAVGRNGQTSGGTAVLIGSDLGGYDWPERRIDPTTGALLPGAKQPHARRLPQTVCTNGFSHNYNQTHVIGFTATYNDFDYTGAVFRLEESISTREKMDKRPAGLFGHTYVTVDPPIHAINQMARRGRILVSTPVWRSMVGFDLLQALNHYPGLGWTRHLPGQFGVQQSFVSFQWLMQYNFEGISNNMCNWNFAEGIGPSDPQDGTPKRGATPGCRPNHWNHLFTLGLGGQGYFRSKLEQRLAVALEPRGQQWLLYGQWWWRSFMNTPIDLSFGTSWFPGSRMNNSWSLLNYFVHKNLVWFEATYYLL